MGRPGKSGFSSLQELGLSIYGRGSGFMVVAWGSSTLSTLYFTHSLYLILYPESLA